MNVKKKPRITAAFLRGARAPANPWDSAAPEWQVPSPPPTHNFVTPPDPRHDPYEYNGKEHA